VSASKNSIVGAGHGHIHPYKICKAHAFLRKLKKYLKLKNRKRKKEKIFTTTDRAICPGSKGRFVPVLEPGQGCRDKSAGGFCPGW